MSLSKFYSFLNENKANKIEKNWTHISAGNPKGSFYIPDEKIEDFYELYKTVKDTDTYIIEKCPPDYCSLRIDLDFKINLSKSSNNSHFYEKKDIKTFIMGLMSYISKLVNFDKDILCFVMEKEEYSKSKTGDYYKDGIHIIFPHLVLDYGMQYWIRDQVLSQDLIKNAFGEMNYINDASDIYDKSIIDKSWTMYWSKGKTDGPLYSITDIYLFNKQGILKKELKKTQIDTNNMARYLSLWKNRKRTQYKEDKLEFINDWYFNKYLKPKNLRKYTEEESAYFNSRIREEDIEVAKQLVKILNVKRSNDREDWIRVCWCLRNIHPERMLQDFIDFSKRCTRKGVYNENTCIETWNTSDESGKLRLGTLHYWAKNDNPEEYKEIMDNTTSAMFEKLPDTHGSIAEIMEKLYGYEFVCCHPYRSVEKREWYHFDNHKWKKNAYSAIRKLLSQEVKAYYKRIRGRLMNKASTSIKDDDSPDTEITKKRIDHVDKIIKTLETTKFLDDVIKEAGFCMYKEEFFDALDGNPNLIGFENGVYDLKQATFRSGYPEDYISMSVGYSFELSMDYIDDVKKFIHSILPEKDVYRYALSFMSTCLDAHNYQQKFLVFTGEGGNGKSLLVNLFEDTLGDYALPLDVALITQKRQKSSAASPEVVSLFNKRLAILSEPNKEDTLNMGIVKALTGSDKIKARGLYKEGIDFRNKAQLLMMSNDLPAPNSQDDGVWRRIRVVHFPMKFVDNPDKNDPFQKQKDYNLEDKMKNWKMAFMNILLAYYKEYRNNEYRVKEPNQVKEYTENYQKQSNIYLEFDRENLCKGDESDSLKINDIYSLFKAWFKENYPSTSVAPMKELKAYYSTKYRGQFKINSLKNMKFKVN